MPVDRAHEAAVKGFTLIELLVALTITLLIAGALAAVMPAARAAFDRLPALLEMQQRGRTAIDTLSQALRAADRIAVASPDEAGEYLELTAIVPVVNGARGVLSVDQSAPGAAITLAVSACPNIKDVCGFVNGTVAMVSDSSGGYDVFVVSSMDAGQRAFTPNHTLSHAYSAGSIVCEVEENTYGLDLQPDGTYSLIRITAAGAVQPIVDFISSLTFDLHQRRVDITLSVHAADPLQRPLIADRIFKTSVAMRNGL
jgi:prepilin-type N-terminal cleavage/methylation domain-containing protein